jgi:hypothetical protein
MDYRVEGGRPTYGKSRSSERNRPLRAELLHIQPSWGMRHTMLGGVLTGWLANRKSYSGRIRSLPPLQKYRGVQGRLPPVAVRPEKGLSFARPRGRIFSPVPLSRGAGPFLRPVVDRALRPLRGILKFLLGPRHVARVGALRSGCEIAFTCRRLVGSVLLALIVALGRRGGGEAAQRQCRCCGNKSEAHGGRSFINCENGAAPALAVRLSSSWAGAWSGSAGVHPSEAPSREAWGLGARVPAHTIQSGPVFSVPSHGRYSSLTPDLPPDQLKLLRRELAPIKKFRAIESYSAGRRERRPVAFVSYGEK